MPSLDFEEEKNRFRSYYSQNLSLLKDAEKNFRGLVESLLAESEIFERPTVSSRVKDGEECIKKFSRKYQTALEKDKIEYEIKHYITDLIGIRIVCLYEEDIKEIARILRESFTVIEITDKISKAESSEDSFGYKGFHMDLAFDDKRKVLPEYNRYKDFQFEVQVRTIIQDGWSVLDHKIKYKKSIPTILKRRINALAAIFELADREFLNIRNETKKLEEKGKEAIKELPQLTPEDEYLDVFDFIKTVQSIFSGYNFLHYKADGFVQEIRKSQKEFTKDALVDALTTNKAIVHEYADFQEKIHSNHLNPYTQIRHALYLSNKEVFKFFLYDQQRDNFEKWLKEKRSSK